MQISAKFSSVLFFALLFTHSSTGCGILTHVAICERTFDALKSYPVESYGDLSKVSEVIEKNYDSFRAGCTYPDTYYTSYCFNGEYHDVSEDTHWTPFTKHALDYIKSLPEPYTQDTKQLIAFLFGLISHQVADIGWHSLGIQDGFIRTMSRTDFHGEYDPAHSTADLGGDVINSFRGFTDALFIKWRIPVDHLHNIYRNMYGTRKNVTDDVIIQCTSLVYLALFGEQLALKEIYTKTAVKSGFLVDELDDYFLGGMFDMSQWSTLIWNDIAQVLYSNRSDCNLDENPLRITCGATMNGKLQRLKSPHKHVKSYLYTNHTLDTTDLKSYRDSTGWLYLQPNKHLRKKILSATPKQFSAPITKSSVTYKSKTANSRFGQSMVMANISPGNFSDLVVSAPYYSGDAGPYQGAVFVVFASSMGKFLVNESSNYIEDIANQTLYGPPFQMSRFGYSMHVKDITQDQIPDLIVGAPAVGSNNLTYMGSVFLYKGLKSGGFESKPYHVIQASDLYPVKNTTLNLGQYVTTITINFYNYLLLGLPKAYHQLNNRSGDVCLLNLNLKPINCIEYGADFGEFGSAAIQSISDPSRVFISAPKLRNTSTPHQFNSNDTQALGAIYSFKFDGIKLRQDEIMYGLDKDSRFGSSMAVGYPYGKNGTEVLAVGMPTIDVNGSLGGVSKLLHQVGGVVLYNISDLSHPISVLYGDREYGRFGAHVKFTDINSDGFDDLIVSAPRRTEDFTELLFPGEEGSVFGFVGPHIPETNLGSVCGDNLQPCPEQLASVKLYGQESHALFGSQITYSNSVKNRVMIISSPLSLDKQSNRRNGAVYIVNN